MPEAANLAEAVATLVPAPAPAARSPLEASFAPACTPPTSTTPSPGPVRDLTSDADPNPDADADPAPDPARRANPIEPVVSSRSRNAVYTLRKNGAPTSQISRLPSSSLPSPPSVVSLGVSWTYISQAPGLAHTVRHSDRDPKHHVPSKSAISGPSLKSVEAGAQPITRSFFAIS